MRLNKVKSKNAVSYYIIRSVRRDGKNSSEIVKKLGTEKLIRETYGVDDVDADVRLAFNAGYLFLQQIYYQLGLA